MALSGATHDDFLFVRQAYYLGAGAWLGPFDNLTLAKGMGYPAFILAAFVSGLPLGSQSMPFISRRRGLRPGS